jgi:hypothetical protein
MRTLLLLPLILLSCGTAFGQQLSELTAAAAYGPTGVAAPCLPGQPCSQSQQGDMQMQLTPVQQQAQLIAAKERERADNSRFASNLVYSGSAVQPQQQQGQAMPAQPASVQPLKPS